MSDAPEVFEYGSDDGELISYEIVDPDLVGACPKCGKTYTVETCRGQWRCWWCDGPDAAKRKKRSVELLQRAEQIRQTTPARSNNPRPQQQEIE